MYFSRAKFTITCYPLHLLQILLLIISHALFCFVFPGKFLLLYTLSLHYTPSRLALYPIKSMAKKSDLQKANSSPPPILIPVVQSIPLWPLQLDWPIMGVVKIKVCS